MGQTNTAFIRVTTEDKFVRYDEDPLRPKFSHLRDCYQQKVPYIFIQDRSWGSSQIELDMRPTGRRLSKDQQSRIRALCMIENGRGASEGELFWKPEVSALEVRIDGASTDEAASVARELYSIAAEVPVKAKGRTAGRTLAA